MLDVLTVSEQDWDCYVEAYVDARLRRMPRYMARRQARVVVGWGSR